MTLPIPDIILVYLPDIKLDIPNKLLSVTVLTRQHPIIFLSISCKIVEYLLINLFSFCYVVSFCYFVDKVENNFYYTSKPVIDCRYYDYLTLVNPSILYFIDFLISNLFIKTSDN